MQTDQRYRVQSVERAFVLLEALADAGAEGMTLSRLARVIGVSKSTAYAILQTMLACGFVADAGTGMARRYRLGMALARLGDVVVSELALRDVAMPELRALTEATGLASRVAVLDDRYAVVVGRVDAPGARIRFTAELGKRELLHCSAIGKAMLSTLPEAEIRSLLQATGLPRRTEHTITDPAALERELRDVARRGYAIDDEEDTPGVFCVGAAVRDHSARCAGAISATGLKLDLPAWRIHQLGETVRDHAARISAQLGAPAPAGPAGALAPGAIG